MSGRSEGGYGVAVIGGGPAGMMAAGTAAGGGAAVVLIEKNPGLGRKLLLTGKGRCNLTCDAGVEGLVAGYPTNGKFLYSALHAFSGRDLIRFFERRGLNLTVERGGRVFPGSGRARDVLRVLRKYLKEGGVQRIRGEVRGIESLRSGFRVLLGDQGLHARRVIVATGGLAYPGTGSTGDGYRFAEGFGHRISPPVPALVPVEVEEGWVRELDGLRLKNVGVEVLDRRGEGVFSGFGEVECTSYGLRGPVILTASSYIPTVDGHRLLLDLKPALTLERLDGRLVRDFRRHARRQFKNALGDLLPRQLIPVIVDMAPIPARRPVHQITREGRRGLAALLKGLRFSLQRFRPFGEAIVTSGGVRVDEIDPRTMASRNVGGLFFAGEVLDVDGLTGGYNLQAAFSTGYLAGASATRQSGCRPDSSPGARGGDGDRGFGS